MGILDGTEEAEETGPSTGDDKNRLFQTHQKSSRSSRNYLKVLGILAVVVVVAGVLISYFTLPRFGDAVRAPKGLEVAVRDHFLVNEKRTSTDITFYNCDTYYWARVGVEKRPDIKTNPVYLIESYKANATDRDDGTWAITATPITSSEMDEPCK
ncbi:MAG: hypothetical protein ABIO36_03065 [Pyrinomonadaceae bacterium]